MSHPNPRHDPENSYPHDKMSFHKRESIGSMTNRLKKMISEPASKEWFAKHGMPKSQALRKKK